MPASLSVSSPGRGISARLRERYLDTLASIYLYNEHRGYTSLDRVLDAVRAFCPDDAGFIAAITSHRADEEKHYRMFRRWFEIQGRMPLTVDHGCGHIDRFVQVMFGCGIDDLDTARVIAEPAQFEKLCRVIMLTEQRGLAQVQVLLQNRLIRADPVLLRIFRIIERDEPSHFLPYQEWLARHAKGAPRWRERLADYAIHKVLLLAKLPALFLNWRTPRLALWPHEEAGVSR